MTRSCSARHLMRLESVILSPLVLFYVRQFRSECGNSGHSATAGSHSFQQLNRLATIQTRQQNRTIKTRFMTNSDKSAKNFKSLNREGAETPALQQWIHAPAGHCGADSGQNGR